MVVIASSSAGGKVLGALLAILFLVWLFQKIGGHITGSGVCPYCGKGLKTNAVACHHCGRVNPKRAKRGATTSGTNGEVKRGTLEWRCEKHGHLLEKSRAVCPIDGSPADWRTESSGVVAITTNDDVSNAQQGSDIDVVLLAAGAKKIAVIKEVRARTGLGLKEAKALVDTAPSVVARLATSEAENFSSALIAAGASVQLQAGGSDHPKVESAGSPVRAPASASADGIVAQLERLAALRASGALSTEEYESLKADLMRQA